MPTELSMARAGCAIAAGPSQVAVWQACGCVPGCQLGPCLLPAPCFSGFLQSSKHLFYNLPFLLDIIARAYFCGLGLELPADRHSGSHARMTARLRPLLGPDSPGSKAQRDEDNGGERRGTGRGKQSLRSFHSDSGPTLRKESHGPAFMERQSEVMGGKPEVSPRHGDSR